MYKILTALSIAALTAAGGAGTIAHASTLRASTAMPQQYAYNVNLNRIGDLRTEQNEPNLNFNAIEGSSAANAGSQMSATQMGKEAGNGASVAQQYPSDARNQQEPNINMHEIDKAQAAKPGSQAAANTENTATSGPSVVYKYPSDKRNQQEPNINMHEIDKAQAAKSGSQAAANTENTETGGPSVVYKYPSDKRNQHEPNVNMHRIDRLHGSGNVW